jgi:hypothetical protein
VGADYFAAIARHLSEALAADCVLIGEFLGGHMERVKTRAANLDGHPYNVEYDLAGSASAQVAVGRLVMCKSAAQSRFPEDAVLRETRAEACIGLSLPDAEKKPAGVLLALYRTPIASFRTARAILEIFADRTAAELVREREDDRLRESDQRYRAFIARNSDAMWRVELEEPVPTNLPEEEQLQRIYELGYVAECNDAAARFMGRDRGEELIGCRVQDLVSLSTLTVREATLAAIRSGYRFSTVETSPVDSQGVQRYTLRSQWGIVEDGKLERIWGSNRDITALKKSEKALDASEQRMADLLETLRMAVVIEDPNGRAAFCNRYLYSVTGWEPNAILGKDWLEMMVPANERSGIRAALAGRATPDSPVHFESTLLGADGSRAQFAWDSALLRDSEGNAAALAQVGRDVTEYRAMQAQLEQADKLASIGRIAGGVAHDFNNLLTVIMGYSGALLENLQTEDSSHEALTQIHKAAQKGAALTQGLLAFGRRQVLRPVVVNLNVIIRDVECILRRLLGEQIRMTTELAEDLCLVRVDPGQFNQVLMNLVVNARDAMPSGGTLTIRTATTAWFGGKPCAQPCKGNQFAEVVVSDTGSGMTEDIRSHMFEPFFTTKETGKGTGLGLSTVYGIVQQSGGHINVETVPGSGTTFHVLLPQVEHGTVETVEQPAPVTSRRYGNETILLVEDQEDVRVLTARVLEDFGYTVLEADGPEKALKLSHDYENTVHLLITDVVMPGTGGIELADTIRRMRCQVRVLFISGYTNCADLADRLAGRAFNYLPKPYTPDQLGAAVRSLLDQE